MINYDDKINKLLKLKEKKENLKNGLIECTKCNIIKELSNFDLRSIKGDIIKYRTDCKLCRKTRNANYYKKKSNKVIDILDSINE